MVASAATTTLEKGGSSGGNNNDVEEGIDLETGEKNGDGGAGGEQQQQQQNQNNKILVEIVSAICVPSMDSYSDADPYVSVYLVKTTNNNNNGDDDKKQQQKQTQHLVHETNEIQDNPNPIWTLETGSLFLIDLEKEGVDVVANNAAAAADTTTKVSFVLRDQNIVGKGEILGSVEIKLKDMMKGKGKRRVYSMDIPQRVLDYNKKKKRTVTKKTKLVLRFKPPSNDELHFIQTLQKDKDGIYANETFLPPQKSRVKLDDEKASSIPQIRGWGAELLKTAVASTADNKEQQTDDTPMMAAMAPSEEWIEVGSGNEGRVYLEILGCNDLPNMDSPTLKNFKNLTDPYCCLIMEDSIVNTSYINDTLFPRWLPNDRRAFVFHVHHPSSQLYVGIFDHDKINRISNKMRKQIHDPIGRVLINLTQFFPDTLYTLQYPIYPVNNESDMLRRNEQHNGTIILRLRIEWGSGEADGIPCCCRKRKVEARNMLVAGMIPPPESYLSVPKRHDFQVAHYTTVGEHDNNKFSMKTLTTYVEELKTFVDEEVIAISCEGVMTILLWRGHWKVQCFCYTLHIPMHSIVSFTWGILVTQNYNRLLSFFLFAVAWFFLATNELRRRHPSPWYRCKSYTDLLGGLLAGTFCGCISLCTNYTTGTEIGPNENLSAIQAYHRAAQQRKEEREKRKEQAAKDAAEMKEDDFNKELEIGASADDAIAVATIQKDSVMDSMNPLRPILHPVQKILFQVCRSLRVVKSIVIWEENYYPFWIVTLSLLGSLLFLFIPWGWILRWFFRIVVWVVLGPWMKILDWFYFQKREHMTKKELRASIQADLRAEYKKRLEYRLLNQKMKERSMKLRSMMRYLFGKFVVRVPRFREAPFCDYPLPASTAEPYPHTEADVEIVGQICGQKLTAGDIIPHRMIQEHPIVDSEPEEKSTLFRSWGSNPKLRSEDDDETPGEGQPLLPKPRGKKRKKIFGLFKKLRG